MRHIFDLISTWFFPPIHKPIDFNMRKGLIQCFLWFIWCSVFMLALLLFTFYSWWLFVPPRRRALLLRSCWMLKEVRFTWGNLVVSLCVGYLVVFFFSAFLGMHCDLIGQKKACLSFCVLHLSASIWRRITLQPSVWVANICLSLATSIFSFSFVTWMVAELDKLG